MNYKIFVQIIGLIGTCFFFLSYQFKNNKTLFRVQLISYIFYTIHFILLGAITGAASYATNLLRSFFLSSENKKFHEMKFCVLICIIQIAVGIITWKGYISLLPMIGNVVLTIGNYTYNPKIIRFTGLFINSPLWMIHNIIVGSIAGIIDEAVMMLSIIISLFRFKKTDN